MKAVRNEVGKIVGFTATESEMWEMDDNSTGVCLNCGEVEEGRCEPDAMGYECSICGETKLCSPTELALMGRIRIIG